MSLHLIYLFDNGIGNLGHTVCLALEVVHCRFKGFLSKIFFSHLVVLLFCEWYFHCQCLQYFHLHIIKVAQFYSISATIPNHIHDIHTDTLTHQGMTTFGINSHTLFVHHIIIFQQAFTNTEVIFFHFLLRTFNGI